MNSAEKLYIHSKNKFTSDMMVQSWLNKTNLPHYFNQISIAISLKGCGTWTVTPVCGRTLPAVVCHSLPAQTHQLSQSGELLRDRKYRAFLSVSNNMLQSTVTHTCVHARCVRGCIKSRVTFLYQCDPTSHSAGTTTQITERVWVCGGFYLSWPVLFWPTDESTTLHIPPLGWGNPIDQKSSVQSG